MLENTSGLRSASGTAASGWWPRHCRIAIPEHRLVGASVRIGRARMCRRVEVAPSVEVERQGFGGRCPGSCDLLCVSRMVISTLSAEPGMEGRLRAARGRPAHSGVERWSPGPDPLRRRATGARRRREAARCDGSRG